jgi:2-dehydro-3-deoxyphosphogalactonate aldolase
MNDLFVSRLKAAPAIAILRGITVEELPEVCDILNDAGIKILEVPLNTPNALMCIAVAMKHCGERQSIGAGTVLSVSDVRNVHAAGGSFIVSPNTDAEVIRETKKLNMVSIPGFYTATEGFEAIKAGADVLKLFPASVGPGYVKDLQAVIKTPILAVGGVNAGNIPDFMKVCSGVGIGSFLYKPGKTMDEIRTAAEAVAKAVGIK